jgi:hypothetical protein
MILTAAVVDSAINNILPTINTNTTTRGFLPAAVVSFLLSP